MSEDIFAVLDRTIETTQPVAGFQHTEYTKHLFDIALRLKDSIPYREDVEKFQNILEEKAQSYKEGREYLINEETWSSHLKELKKMLAQTSLSVPSKHTRT